MQENRSFDNYFGTLGGVRGFDDRTALELRNGDSVFAQPDGNGGSVLPFLARTAVEQADRLDSDVQYLGSLDHIGEGGREAWADGWVSAKTASTMCDAYHCSLRGPTNPNRLYLWTGTVGFEPGTQRRVVPNDASDEDTHQATTGRPTPSGSNGPGFRGRRTRSGTTTSATPSSTSSASSICGHSGLWRGASVRRFSAVGHQVGAASETA
jgi:phospholipase C